MENIAIDIPEKDTKPKTPDEWANFWVKVARYKGHDELKAVRLSELLRKLFNIACTILKQLICLNKEQRKL